MTELLAARRSRLWQLVAPADLAAWVFADPVPAPLDPSPADTPTDWADGLDEAGRAAWALAGWVARLVVPEAATTVGKHWLLSRLDDTRPAKLRLTVGVLEILGLYESGEEVWLRVHGWLIGLALEAGALDLAEWERRGIGLEDDRTKTLAEEKFLLRCPDLETAFWLLRQPPVIAGLRLLSCWVAAGPFSFEGRYRPEVVGRAWQASASLSGGVATSERGFDRPYAGATVTADLPAQRSFDAPAYRAGVREHDELCRLMIARLAASGLSAGAGLSGVDVDLAWRDADGRQFVAEVKSITDANHAEQLRLGLGQVLEYRHRLRVAGLPVNPVLLVRRLPDPAWRQVCAENGVVLLAADDDLGGTPFAVSPVEPVEFGDRRS
ncbi:hypothetical protein [Micromonospora echinospora]|uniref:hypothetical protein n=1 Tax=Micromonospora echinospora TaxID=1877 RepID=UPI003671314D